MPDFLSYDDIVAIHRDQVARYGGSLGIRDVGLLQSAAARPQATFPYSYGVTSIVFSARSSPARGPLSNSTLR